MKFFGAVASVGLMVAGASAAVALPGVTGVGIGSDKAVVSGSVDPNNLSGASLLMQFPFARSFPSASGGRGPRVVLLSYSEQVDSGAFPERLRTDRSVDGGGTWGSRNIHVGSWAKPTPGVVGGPGR